VLLISSTALGDTLFSTPAIRALKERYPAWELEVLVHRVFGRLLAHNPYVNRLWVYPGRNRRLLYLARDLRQRHYDLVIILHGNDPEATMLASLSGSPYIIGSARSSLSLAYSAQVAPQGLFEHAVELRLNSVRLLGADTENKRMDIFLPPEALHEAEAILADHFGEAPPLLLALHPTASHPYKWWPAENFRELGGFLFRHYGASLVIVSGNKDRAYAETLAGSLPGPTLVAGRLPLLTVAALLSRCGLLVANDSGPLHLGLALGIPTIGLIGAHHPSRIGPYQANWGRYLYKREEACPRPECLAKKCRDNQCLKAIQVEEVVQMLKTWWQPRFMISEVRGRAFHKS
jgi:ADP-heptose:LPS heptosyltransferase